MKTLKSKILTPFLLLTVMTPLLTLLIFNVSMRFYVIKNAKAELRNTAQTMQIIIKEELAANFVDFPNDNLSNIMKYIKGSMLASKLSRNTEILIFSGSGKLFYPTDLTQTDISTSLIDYISRHLNASNANSIIRNKNSVFIYQRLLKADIDRNPYIVYVTDLNSADGIIRIINLMLFIIMLAGVCISVLVTTIFSNRLSSKFNRLCVVAGNIGKGDFHNDFVENDILEIHHLSQSISEMADKIARYDQAQKTFLQDASHEIRTPLMSIQGYAEGIENGIMPDVKNAARIIGSESRRLGSLVDELLTLSRIENQTYSKALVKTNLNNSLKEYLQRLEGLALKTGRQITISLPQEEIYVDADDTLLSQAVTNIISNSLRYAKNTVKIALTREKNTAVIRISDDGDGLYPADLPHIFDRFYKGKSGNFGLGLAIAKSAVTSMGGSITAYNRNGAVFEIRL